jgi:hypothetical protein
MTKLFIFFNRREHYKNRLKLRKGSSIWFLFSRVIDRKYSYKTKNHDCLVWKFRNHIYLTENNQLQTYIKK